MRLPIFLDNDPGIDVAVAIAAAIFAPELDLQLMENMRLPIFLDTDPGIDDAVAIAAAIFAPELDLQLMTTVAGNVSVEALTMPSPLPPRFLPPNSTCN